MKLKGKKVGFVLTGSFCTFKNTILQIENIMKEDAEVIPIMSNHAYEMDTKFGTASDFINQIENITKKKIIHTIQDAEPIGPKNMTDIMIVAPATGNTMAKVAGGITDTPATMAIKSHLRNRKENIGKLLNRKHFFFVPFRQDNPITKPRSLVFDPKYIIPTLEDALEKEQIQPILL